MCIPSSPMEPIIGYAWCLMSTLLCFKNPLPVIQSLLIARSQKMDPSMLPTVQAVIAARGYGSGARPLPSTAAVLHAITSAFGAEAPAWVASDEGAEADSSAPLGLERLVVDPDSAPSSATVMRAASGARAALTGLAAIAPGAAPPFGPIAAGKRIREAPAAAASGAPDSSGSRLHVLAKRPRGRPRRALAIDAPAAAAAGSLGGMQVAVTGGMEGGGASGAGASTRDFGPLPPDYAAGPTFDEPGVDDLTGPAAREADDGDSDAASLPTGRLTAQLPVRRGASVGRGQHLPKGVTDHLIAWVIEHKKSPYPTNGEPGP